MREMQKNKEDEKRRQLIYKIDGAILTLEGPYKWLYSKCTWLGIFIGDDNSKRFHVWHSRLQLWFSTWIHNWRGWRRRKGGE